MDSMSAWSLFSFLPSLPGSSSETICSLMLMCVRLCVSATHTSNTPLRWCANVCAHASTNVRLTADGLWQRGAEPNLGLSDVSNVRAFVCFCYTHLKHNQTTHTSNTTKLRAVRCFRIPGPEFRGVFHLRLHFSPAGGGADCIRRSAA